MIRYGGYIIEESTYILFVNFSNFNHTYARIRCG